jgi:hypothetical protein
LCVQNAHDGLVAFRTVERGCVELWVLAVQSARQTRFTEFGGVQDPVTACQLMVTMRAAIHSVVDLEVISTDTVIGTGVSFRQCTIVFLHDDVTTNIVLRIGRMLAAILLSYWLTRWSLWFVSPLADMVLVFSKSLAGSTLCAHRNAIEWRS